MLLTLEETRRPSESCGLAAPGEPLPAASLAGRDGRWGVILRVARRNADGRILRRFARSASPRQASAAVKLSVKIKIRIFSAGA
jgi:hypothetical protein